MTAKTFVLDTSVLVHDPEALIKFPKQQVVVPLAVLEELDQMKRLPNEVGYNSLAVIRFMDGLKRANQGDWKNGVQVANEARIWVELDRFNHHEHFRLDRRENRTIMTAYELMKDGHRVTFVTKDFATRIKAEATGLVTEDYENLKVSFEKIYRGIHLFAAEKKEIDLLLKDGRLSFKKEEFRANEYCFLQSPDEQSNVLSRYDAVKEQLYRVADPGDLWGVRARNLEQQCAIDLLLKDDVKLVTLVGQAGTGKTLLALAAALRKVFDEEKYSRILVSRPVVPLGKDIGYLPGTKDEKLMTWMQPIYDNLAFLCDATGVNAEANETLRWVTESKRLEMEAVTYIRGRSLPKMFIIIDEAQNLTPHEVKTIISRAGEGTKVVLCGDPTQIDKPHLDRDSSGLTFTVDKFQNRPIYGHITLEKTERSELAAIAAEVM